MDPAVAVGRRRQPVDRHRHLDHLPELGHHAATGGEPGHDLLRRADTELCVVVEVGQPHEQLLANQRRHRRRDGAGPVGGENAVDGHLGAVGEHPLELVHHVHARQVPVLGVERRVPVDQHHDGGLVAPGLGVEIPAPIELGSQEPDEPHLALALGGADHRPGVRQQPDGIELSGAEVDDVEVQAVGRVQPRQAQRDGAERGGGAGAADTEHEEVALSRVPSGRILRLALGVVGQGDRRPRASAVGPGAASSSSVQIDHGRQGVGPWPARIGPPGAAVGLGDGLDEQRRDR